MIMAEKAVSTSYLIRELGSAGKGSQCSGFLHALLLETISSDLLRDNVRGAVCAAQHAVGFLISDDFFLFWIELQRASEAI